MGCEKVVIGAYLPVVCTVQPLDDSNIDDNVKNYVKNNHSCCIGEWDVSRVTNMNSLFKQFASFDQNLSSWNVAKVTDMGKMFYEASWFNQNLGSWNVAKVTDMDKMFYQASEFDQKLCWDLSHITDDEMKFNMFSSEYCMFCGTICKATTDTCLSC